jgi:hypothetical protein
MQIDVFILGSEVGFSGSSGKPERRLLLRDLIIHKLAAGLFPAHNRE